METNRLFAEIAVLSPTGKQTPETYTYHVPPALQPRLAPGSLVTVPFGKRRLYGIVLSLAKQTSIETKPVGELIDEQPVLHPYQIELAQWISAAYLAPLYTCLQTMLPPGLVGHTDVKVSLTAAGSLADARTDAQRNVLTALEEKGALRGKQLSHLLPRDKWQPAIDQLARRGVIDKAPFLAPPSARPKEINTVEWSGGDVAIEDALDGLRSACYPDIIAFLKKEEQPVDVSWVYTETGCTHYHLSKLAERELVTFDTAETWRDPLADATFVPDTPPQLTSDQAAVWETISTCLATDQHDTFLLHGVTGSGKTEIYLRAAAQVQAQGQQAIVLVPEISLTPQTAHRFGARFGHQVAILHSALSEGERYDVWRQIRAGEKDVVVGPRSALFAPLPEIGLIVLDEEHEDTYKQAAPVPRYHARETACHLARLTGASVILGSATPSLEAYYRAQQGSWTLLEMPRRVMGHARRIADLQSRYHISQTRFHALSDGPSEARYMDLPPVQVVDLKAELQAGNRSIFSRTLQRAMREALDREEQVILFLNRRGTATFVLCRDCGYVATCPRCDIPLTYHGPKSHLVCHHCNHRQPQPTTCPECGSDRIRYFGLGTERVEQAVQQLLPEARTLRWDRDTARDHTAHASILHQFSSGMAHVLVGTQMVAKGLDLPRVTVVGVISADTALNLPDFRAAERTFQLMAQVAGRAGRSVLGGRVILQTYHPDHYAITAASEHDFTAFAAQELAFRQEMGYPPYRRLATLIYEDESPRRARQAAETFGQTLRQILNQHGLPATDLLGPAPPFFARVRGRYRWQLILRHDNPPRFLRDVQIPPGWRVNVDPVSVL